MKSSNLFYKFFLSLCCCFLIADVANAATKQIPNTTKTKENARREASVAAKSAKDAGKEVRMLMYDGMTYKELEKKVNDFEFSRWNSSEYGVMPLVFSAPSLRCTSMMAAPMMLFPHARRPVWTYSNLNIPNTLPISFSCARHKTWNGVNYRILDSKISLADKNTYILRKSYRRIPVKYMIEKEVEKDVYEVYAAGFQPTHKWNAFETQSGYMFSGFLDGFFDIAKNNRRISSYYLAMRDLFKMDVGQCFLSRTRMEEPMLDVFFGITKNTLECTEKLRELYDTGKVVDFKRIRQGKITDEEYAVEVDNWFDKFLLKDDFILNFFENLSKDIKVDKNTKLFEYLQCNNINNNAELNKYVVKHAAKTNCASVNRVIGKSIRDHYQDKELLRFVYYYSQANQAEKGQHCFYPKVFSTTLTGSQKRIVRDIPGGNVFCATDENLEETLQASYAALKSQFAEYSTEFPIFIPIGFLKSRLTNMDGIVFPEAGNIGPKYTVSPSGMLDRK